LKVGRLLSGATGFREKAARLAQPIRDAPVFLRFTQAEVNAMTDTVRDVMNPMVVCVTSDESLMGAACAMRDADIGNVLVMDGEKIVGILTDRDIVVRAIAEGKNVNSTYVNEIASKNITTVSPDEEASQAVSKMREKAIRRLPVVENEKVVGILSIGDLAQERDPQSALADISKAPANR